MQVSGFKQGDLVVPFEPAQGTWRQRGVFPATAFMAIPNDTPIEAAAQLIIKYVRNSMALALHNKTGAWLCPHR
jgi:NADPH:quinone reductase-like Zn-dependent oxidoreductase